MAEGRVPVNVSLSCCFGCPMEGDVPEAEVLRWSERFAELGVRGLTICDTTGMAHPAQVSRLTQAMQQRFGKLQLTLHFHNTRGMGLANVLAAVQQGISRFDGSLGGLGGCPYAPGPPATSAAKTPSTCCTPWATTPASTCHACWRWRAACRGVVGHDVPGQVAKAGRITDLHPAPSYVAELRSQQP
jgi:hydroxymethylglutaryl-CoA lyase